MSIEKVKPLVDELNILGNQYSKLLWTEYTVGFDFGLEEAQKKINDFLCSKENFEVVKSVYNDDSLGNVDKRRAEIVYNSFESFHLSDEINELSLKISNKTNELSKILNTHRSTIDGVEVSSVDIAQILANNPDRDMRKKAYLARTQVNSELVKGGFLELLSLRNELAVKKGYKDFVEMKLDDNELSTKIFSSWKDELKELIPIMKDTRKKVANRFLNDDEIKPWDEAYVLSQIAPSLNITVDMSSFRTNIRNFFLNFGVDIDEYNITYDIFPRANKSEWGYNFTISEDDSRVLANVKNMFHEYGVLLHETGHAVHHFLMDREELILNQGVSGIISEGIANLFGGFLYDEMFYKTIFEDTTGLKDEFESLKEFKGINSLRAIVNILFDQELYKNELNSNEDIENLTIQMHSELLGEDISGESYPWGFRIHHTTHPIYLHNYFMGDVTCEMIKQSFCKKYECKSVLDKPVEFMEFLKDCVIAPSGLYKYAELYKRISGEEFSLKYMKPEVK